MLDNPKIGSPSDEEEIHFGPFSPMKITRKTVRGLTAEVIRDIIIIAQYNLHIWHNESEARKGNDAGNNLLLTHSLNGIRNRAKNRLQTAIIDNNRLDHKVDCLSVEHTDWEPSNWGLNGENE